MGNDEEFFFMEGTGDSFNAHHCVQCFNVSMVLCVSHLVVARRSFVLCYVLAGTHCSM